jgi:hypothetical protein
VNINTATALKAIPVCSTKANWCCKNGLAVKDKTLRKYFEILNHHVALAYIEFVAQCHKYDDALNKALC